MTALLLLRQRELEEMIRKCESDGFYRPDLEEELESLKKLNSFSEVLGVDLEEHDGNLDLEEESHQRDLDLFHYESAFIHSAESRAI